MNNKPAVSIIMPVFNGEKYLAESMKSIFSQTLKNVEIICVDDGSKDNSLEILHQYAEQDSRVVVFEQTNQGSGAARNLALREAKGEYVVFLDCDDFYPNERTLENLYSTITQKNVDICGGSFSRYIYRELHTDFPEELKDYTFTEEKLMSYREYQFDFGYHRFIYKLDFLRKNEIIFPDLKRFQDVPFLVKAMITAGEFYAIPDVTYCYRKEPSRLKPIDWPSEKFRDVLKGITQNLKMSREAKLERLHARCWSHFTSPEYFTALKSALYRNNYETISLVRPLVDEIDFTMLEEAGVKDFLWINDFQKKIDDCLSERDQLLEYVSQLPASDDIAVSVVMPSLNVEPYIRRCIESVMKQTLQNIEIICVDAGSTDGTLEILNEYAQHDSRIKVLLSDQKSYGHQVNMGIDAAKGQYIAIVETDDYIPSHMYNSLYEKVLEESLEVVKGDFYVFLGDGKTETMEYRKILVSKEYYRQVLSGTEFMKAMPGGLSASMYIWAGLYKADFLKAHNIRCQETPGASFQDNGFWFSVLMYAERMYFMAKPYYHLRRDNPNSSVMATNKTACMKDEYDFIRKNIEQIQDEEKKDMFKKYCTYYRFKNYIFTYGRISELSRVDYLKRISQEFLDFEAKGELDFSLFKRNEHHQLANIMTDPVAYYETSSDQLRANARKKKVSPSKQKETRSAHRNVWQRLLAKVGKGLLFWSNNGFIATVKKFFSFLRKKLKL